MAVDSGKGKGTHESRLRVSRGMRGSEGVVLRSLMREAKLLRSMFERAKERDLSSMSGNVRIQEWKVSETKGEENL